MYIGIPTTTVNGNISGIVILTSPELAEMVPVFKLKKTYSAPYPGFTPSPYSDETTTIYKCGFDFYILKTTEEEGWALYDNKVIPYCNSVYFEKYTVPYINYPLIEKNVRVVYFKQELDGSEVSYYCTKHKNPWFRKFKPGKAPVKKQSLALNF